MGDMKEVFQDMQDAKKERHEKWYRKNMEELNGMLFTNKRTVLLFREDGKPKVDFYPHTGRWKVGNTVYRGGAKAFKGWYVKQ